MVNIKRIGVLYYTLKLRRNQGGGETTEDSVFLPDGLAVCGGLQFRQRQMQGTRFHTGETLAAVVEKMLPVFRAHLLQMGIVLILGSVLILLLPERKHS